MLARYTPDLEQCDLEQCEAETDGVARPEGRWASMRSQT